MEFSNKIQHYLWLSITEALRLKQTHINTGHLLLAILDASADVEILQNLGIEPNQLKKSVEHMLELSHCENLFLSEQVARALLIASLDAGRMNTASVETSGVLLAMLRDRSCIASQVLDGFQVDFEDLRRLLDSKQQKLRRSTTIEYLHKTLKE